LFSGEAFQCFPAGNELFPSAALGQGTKVEFNFGAKPFLYKMDVHEGLKI
jgi:hypothetical protein